MPPNWSLMVGIQWAQSVSGIVYKELSWFFGTFVKLTLCLGAFFTFLAGMLQGIITDDGSATGTLASLLTLWAVAILLYDKLASRKLSYLDLVATLALMGSAYLLLAADSGTLPSNLEIARALAIVLVAVGLSSGTIMVFISMARWLSHHDSDGSDGRFYY